MTPLTSTTQPWYIKQFGGMNTKLEENEIDLQHGILAQNCRFENEPGSVIKRQPISYYNGTSMGSGGVKSIYRFYQSDGTATLLAIHGTSLYKGTDATGVMTAIKTGLTESKRACFITYKDLCYISNGYDNILIYDGAADNVCWEMGACKAVLASGGSNLDSGAAYYYAITMDSDAYICGAVSNTVTTDASNRKVTLSNIPLGPVGTTDRKIYRTEGGGSTLKLLATISDNTTTTYADDIADGSLGAAMGAVTDDVPLGSELQIHRERLFIARDPNNPNRIYYSNPYLPHYIQQTTNLDYMDIEPDDNDEISGIPIQLGVMCCIKKNTIRKLHITSATSGSDPASWYADDPIAFNGCPAPWSIVQTPYGIIYLGWDHWYIFNGVSSQVIIDEFDTKDIAISDYSDTVCHWNSGILLAAYTDATDQNIYHDRLMRYNWIRKALGYDKLNIDSLTSYSGDDESGDLHYGDSTVGFVYRAEDNPLWVKYQKKSQMTGLDRNILWNGDMEGWANGASSAPDYWTLTGSGATVAREASTIVDFSYSAAVTRVGNDCYLTQSYAVPVTYRSKTITLGAWVYATVASRVRIAVYDSGGNTNSSYHSGGSAWEWIEVSHTVDASATSLSVRLEVNTGNTTGYFDTVILVDNTTDANEWRHDIYVGGTEDNPYVEVGRDETIDDMGQLAADTIDDLEGTINMNDVTGSFVLPSMNIRAGTLGELSWNESLFHASDTINVYTRTGASQAACEAATWDGPLSNPNGSPITSTANTWIQIKFDMKANSTAGSPKIYFTDGFVIRFDYRIGGTVAETAVEFIYEVGFRNFDLPAVDKIFKKIVSVHEATAGNYTLSWYTEYSLGEFTIDLTQFTYRWESFFPSTAFGRKLNLRIYKNDLEDFKVKEYLGIFTPEPVII